jgi:hypothetical protein
VTSAAKPANSKRDIWIGVGVIVLLLALIGKCGGSDDDKGVASAPSSTVPATTTEVDFATVVNLTGVVSKVDDDGDIYVDLDRGKKQYRTRLAHVTDYTCSAMRPAFAQSVRDTLKSGTRVTLVRMPSYAGSKYMSDESFVFVSASKATSVTPSRTTPTTTISTAPSTTVSVTPTTTSAPQTTATGTAVGQSVNEQIIALGSAGVEPAIYRGALAKPFEVEAAEVKERTGAEAARYIDALIGADAAAWDGRIGAMGTCRDEKEESDRKFYGPDMIPHTDDDPVYSSSGSSNGGGSGGESRFCSKRWWC